MPRKSNLPTVRFNARARKSGSEGIEATGHRKEHCINPDQPQVSQRDRAATKIHHGGTDTEKTS
jgi:hypothetical protein